MHITRKYQKTIDQNLIEHIAKKFQMESTEYVASLDSKLATRTKETGEIECIVENLQEAINLSCNKSFKILENLMYTITQKSVPKWTEELTIKKLNVLRRLYQRTKNYEHLIEHRKNRHNEEKQHTKQ